MTLVATGWMLELDSPAAAAAFFGASVDAVDASCCRDDAEEGFGMAVNLFGFGQMAIAEESLVVVWRLAQWL